MCAERSILLHEFRISQQRGILQTLSRSSHATTIRIDNLTFRWNETINPALYTCEDQVSHVTFQLCKKKIEKDNERDQIMAKIMTQLDILSKNFMGTGTRGVNVVGVGNTNPNDMKFEAIYN